MENLGLPTEIIANINSFKPRDRDMSTPHGKIMGKAIKNTDVDIVLMMLNLADRHWLDVEPVADGHMRVNLDLWCYTKNKMA